MSNNLILKKCSKCGAIIEEIKKCDCQDCRIMCCNEKMQELTINDQEASFEKHIPNYEIKNDNIIIKVNHVMDDDHYIEWISIRTEKEIYTKKFNPHENPELIFKLQKNAVIYSYCNKHGLWKQEIKEGA